MKSFIAIVTLGILLILATTPMMAASVQGVWIGGNPTCEEIGASLGYNWTGMKIDPVRPGTYSDGTLTVGVTVSGKSFDWTSNIPVSAVYVKGGPGGSLYNYEDAESTGDTNLISIRDTDAKQFGLSHLNFCYDVDLDLTVSKDAQTAYTRTWEWDIEKSVDVSQHDLFDGQEATSNYSVDVYKTGYADSDWLVTGNIWINNPTSIAATIVSVDDVVSDAGNAAVDCGVTFPYDLASNGDLHCTYSLSLPDSADRLNTVTVSTSGSVNGGSATADVLFGEPSTELYAEVNVEDSYTGSLGATDEDATYNYSRTFMCDQDEGLHENIATIVETGQTAQADVYIECLVEIEEDLEVSKDAQTSYTRTWEWEIEKSVDTSQHDLFNGQEGTSNYTVEVYKVGYTDSDWLVTGNIWIHNPAPVGATILSVDDIVGDVGAADVDCGVIFPYILEAGDDLHCTYSLDLPDDSYQLNTVTVTTDGLVGGNSAIADVYFDEPTTELNAEVNVEDSIVGYLGIVGDYETEFEYSHTFTCPDDEGSNENIATIVETGQTASATVEVTCYAPEVSKTAETSWTQTYEWSIQKTVDVAHHQLSEGESGTSTYTVTVDRTAVGSNFFVTGVITVYNPHPWEPLTVDVSDTISGGISPELDCGGQLVVDPGETEYCGYGAFLPDNTDRVNEAVVSAFGIDYYAYADVIFSEPTGVGYPSVNVDDTYAGYLGNASDDTTFTYSRTFTCGQDAGTQPNTATIVETGQSASATVIVDCVNQNPPTWCSPGYWKQPHHLDSWPIDPNTLYNDVFDPDLLGNPTLLDVISQPEVYGGPTTNMIADYLSSLHPDINFDGTRYEDSCLLN